MYGPKTHRRQFLVPEVVQSSAMDCGPAALKCVLEGFGIPVSYGRLREACQTDVDGTSIDTMETVAAQLGVESEQIMTPVDHLLSPEARALPAIVVVRQPNGLTHFVVAWRTHGRFVQIMDPAIGRRWLTCEQLLGELYVHLLPVPAAAWREWAASDEFLNVLRRRIANLGLSKRTMGRLIEAAIADKGWRSLAALDAIVRMVDLIVLSRGLRRGQEAARVIETLFHRARKQTTEGDQTVPARYWSVRPARAGPDGEEQLMLRGAVLVRLHRRGKADQSAPFDAASQATSPTTLRSPDLDAALSEPPNRPGRELLSLLRADGLLAPAMLASSLTVAAGGIVVEALLLRGLFDLSREMALPEQRLGAMGALVIFVVGLLFVELPIAAGLLRAGRLLEARVRLAFLEKMPRLGDRYFRSRLTSDMAERSHVIHGLRLLPDVGGRFIRAAFELVLTAAGIVWLDPASAPIAFLAIALAVGLPLVFYPSLSELDLRVRTHAGALSRYYLDALLGLVTIRAHAAERSVRREHEGLLVDWARAGLSRQRAAVALEGAQAFVGFGLAAWLVVGYLMRGHETGGVLLLVYWAFNLPVLGLEIALFVRNYPAFRNMTTRLLEPLGAPEENAAQGSPNLVATVEDAASQSSRGVAVLMKDVSVRAAGHTILEEINLSLEAGSHVAIVGRSGAGKSSLVGLLLGWYGPATGQVLVNRISLAGEHLDLLRKQTAWVDPAVHLWNRSLIENLSYGAATDTFLAIDHAIEAADLREILDKLPDGLQTPLGEGGGLVSGGEGQRVRLGRALLRSDVRLVILDEPFRGLQREQRRELLARVRSLWHGATLLCITHDISETKDFERVIVMAEGRIVEDGDPQALVEATNSRYGAMLRAESAARDALWSLASWRRLRVASGQLVEQGLKGGQR
jgi:ABC-type bacteriocin/lantibiotic exporter with double-glycine peptidase domain